MPGSTAIAPLTPRAAPASAARVVSGRTPTTTSTMSAARVTAVPSAAVAWTCSRPAPPGGALLIAWTVVPVSTSHAMGGQFGMHQGAELGVDGGQHLGRAVPSG